ncbi:MAG: helix-turn-helix transcriptional regulator [Clostridiales bacterium]|nr:helix-turn-helix transcriptional regulator [Clostridiales bacterium]
MINIDKELQRLLLLNRENVDKGEWGSSDAFRREMIFYDIVASGDITALERLYNHPTALKLKGGTLSNDPVVNQRYHSIITAALLSRFCIQAGLDVAISYTISDIFIRMIDNSNSIEEIQSIHRQMAEYYCRKMKSEKQKYGMSKHVVSSIEYIREHIQENLSIETIAVALDLNPSYLSKLFKQEMNVSISQYIRDEKIKIATKMLRYLNESSLDIANYLGFSSQSHFIQVFKKNVGMTPEEYRRQHYHKAWLGDDEFKDQYKDQV